MSGVNRVTKAVLEAEVRSFIADMERAAKAVSDVAEKAEIGGRKSSRAQRSQAKSMEEVANKASAMGLAVGAGVGLAVKKFADFDEAMSRTRAATGATGKVLDDLREAAIEQGAATKFSATEAADGITELAKAGVDAKAILGGGLAGALDLAAAGQMDVARAAEVTAVTLKQFGLSGTQATHVADLLAAGAGKAVGSVEDMAQALKYAGVPAASLGLTVEETAGTLGLFAEQGIIGEQAGTSFRSMLMSLAAPSKVAKETMDDLGVTLYDGTGQFIGMEDAAEELRKKLGPLTEAQRNAALGTIFGNESMSAAIALYNAGGQGVADWTSKVNDAGFAASQAAALTDNLKGDVERLGGALDATFVQNGSSANSALRGLAQGATGLIEVVGDIPAPMTMAGASITALGLVVPKVVTSFRDATQTLDDVGLSLDKISAKSPKAAGALRGVGAAAGTLAVLGVAGSAMQNVWDQAAGAGDDATRALERYATAGKDAEDVPSALAMGFDNLEGSISWALDPGGWRTIREGFAELGTGFGLYGGTQMDQAQQFFTILDDGLTGLVRSGKPEMAAELFREVAAEAQRQDKTLDQVKSALPGYSAALDSAASSSSDMTTSTRGLNGELTNAGQTAEDAAKSMDDLVSSLQDLGAELLGQRGSARDFEAAIDDATSSLKENGETLDINTDAGRANQAALDNIASSTANWAAKSAEAGASASEVAGILSKGRKAFLDFAADAGMSAGEARKLADSMGLVPSEVDTLFTAAGVAESQKATEDLISTYFGAPKRVSTIFDTPGSVASQEQAATTTHFYEMVPDEVVTPFSTPGAAESAKAAWGVESNIRSIPKSWSSQITVSGADAAANAAWRVKAALDAIPRRVGSSVIVNSISHNIPRARGALMRDGVSAYAGGGISLATGQVVPRVPQIAKGGTYALWAERKTGWEAYISGLPAERDRNVRIWQDAGRLLGMPDWLLAAATARQYAAGELQGRYVSQSAYDDATRHGVAVDQGWQRRMLRQELDGLEVVMDGYRVGRLTQRAQGARRL